MEPEGSLPHSQERTAFPSPERLSAQPLRKVMDDHKQQAGMFRPI
jgi:hypothetical protein